MGIRFLEHDLDWFARVSGDVNPLHMDSDYARRTAYGQRVTFGILGALAALSGVKGTCKSKPSSLTMEFRQPIYPGRRYHLLSRSDDSGQTIVELRDGETVSLCVEIEHDDILMSSDLSDLTDVTARLRRKAPAALEPTAIAGAQTLRGVFQSNRAADGAPKWFADTVARFGEGLVDTLMATSYLVGMELPGERALFSKLKLSLGEGPRHSKNAVNLVLQPQHYNEDFGLLQMTLRALHGQGLAVAGTLEAFVRRDVSLPEPGAISKLFAGQATALPGQTALVTGGSRGLGAALVMSLVAQGCHVYLVYRNSREKAEQVARACTAFDARVTLLQGDVADGEWCSSLVERIRRERGALDILVCNAATAPSAMQGEKHEEEWRQYLETNLAITRTPLRTLLPIVSPKGGTVVAVSSVFVDERPEAFRHYVALKVAVEAEIEQCAEDNPDMAFLLPRAPRMLTEMTNTPQAMMEAVAPEVTAAAIVNAISTDVTRGAVKVLPATALGGTVPRRSRVAASDEAPPEAIISASFTAEPLSESLTFWSRQLRLPLLSRHTDYNQVFRQLLDPNSELARNRGGVNAVLLRVVDWLRERDNNEPVAAKIEYLRGVAREFSDAVVNFAKRSASAFTVMICPSGEEGALVDVIADIEKQLQSLNDGAMGLCIINAGDYHSAYNVGHYLDPVRDELGHMPYQPDYYHLLGTLLMRFYYSTVSKPYKVIVCDCDNTLWEGVCGEDGPGNVNVHRQFAQLQKFVRARVDQGMLLCLCSKNNPDDVHAVFEQCRHNHLHLRHCAANAISWSPKSESLKALAQRLNLGLDSFIFIDDNPVECAEVRAGCPQVLTIQWPSDEAQAQTVLDHTWAFDRFLVTEEDTRRTTMYRAEQERGALQVQVQDYGEFLQRLELRVEIRPPDKAELARVSQLTYRTNQFNFSGKRRSLSDVGELLAAEPNACHIVRCRDRFGDYGLVGVLILRTGENQLVIDSFLLSCRVLGRGVEHRMMVYAGEQAEKLRLHQVAVELRPTQKNEPARRFLETILEKTLAAEAEPLTLSVTRETLQNVAFQPGQGVPDQTETISKQSQKFPCTISADCTETTHMLGSLSALTKAVAKNAQEVVAEQDEKTPYPPASSSQYLAIQDQVLTIFANVLHVALRELSVNAELDQYVRDSFKVVELTVALKRQFPSLPATFLYEHRTIADVVGALAPPGDERQGGSASPPEQEPSADTGRSPVKPAVKDAIAIVGMSCRLPGADGPDAFWQLLSEGRSAFSKPPQGRWQPGELPHAGDVRGGFLDDIDRFDASLFGVSPREALYMDPQQRLFLESIWSLLEDAGYNRASLARDTGVFVGVIANDYGIHAGDPATEGDVPYRWTDYYQIANRVSYFFDLHGPSLSVDTACSSSGTAIHLACESLHRGECSSAIAGGVNLFLHPSRFVQYRQMGIISKSGVCRPFGADADGTLYGEGVGALLLKPLSDAERDGDRIHGIIRATAMNAGGRTNGFTVPNPMAQADLVEQALTRAKVDTATIGYIEAHGTGTSLGDPIEVRGLSEAFSRGCSTASGMSQHCSLGSVKGNIGHLESAAAVIGVIKVLLQMREGRLSPSLNAEQPNPMIQFEDTPFKVQTSLSDWRRPGLGIPRRAGVSSFGAGGGNAHLILEEYSAGESDLPRSNAAPVVLPVSAHNPKALRRQVERLRDAVDKQDKPDLKRIAYTLQTGREPLHERVAIIASTPEELLRHLQGYLQDEAEQDAVLEGRVDARFASVFNALDIASLPGASSGELGASQLKRLALLWSTGATIDWHSLYGGIKLRPVSLPTYPFGGRRYYLPRELQRAATQPVSGNPLLGERLESPFIDGVLYRARYHLQRLPYLGSHRIHDRVIVPGSLYIALALTLLQQERPEYPVAFQNVTFLKAIEVTPMGNTDIQSHWRGEHGTLEIVSRRDAGEWQTHCTLTCATVPATSSTVAPVLSEVRERCREPMAREAFYDFGDTLGFHWRDGFRAVQSLWRGPGEALAKVRLQDSLAADMEHCEIHPAFLDACFQPFVAALNEQRTAAGDPYLPLGVEEVIMHRRPPQEVWAYAKLSDEVHDRSVTFDIVLFDDNGAVCAVFHRMTALRASASELSGGAASSRQSLYRTAWETIQTPNVQVVGRRRIVVSADGQQPSQIAEQLRAIGEPVTRILVADFDAQHLESGSTVIFEIPAVTLTSATLESLYCVWGALQTVVSKLVDTPSRDIRLWLVTQAAQALDGSEPAGALIGGAFWGVGRCLAWEHREFWGGLLDLSATPAEHDPAIIRSILNGSTGENQLALRGREHVRACRIRPYRPSAEAAAVSVDGDASYLVTGGLGSLGRALCEWLVGRGARTVILAGRGELTDESRAWLENHSLEGVVMEYHRTDVGDERQVAMLLHDITQKRPPLRGIVHAAGCLDDGLFIRQTPEQLQRVFQAKAASAWHLHRLLEDRRLDFFIMTSTASTLMGAPGQTNYVLANAFLEALARYRQRSGLPALAVAWGPWEGSRMVSQAGENRQRSWTGTDYGALSLAEAAEIFDAAHRCIHTDLAVLPYHWPSLVRDINGSALPSPLKSFSQYAESAQPGCADSDANALDSEEKPPIAQSKQAQSKKAQSKQDVEQGVVRLINQLLGYTNEESFERGASFRDIGLDSLTAVRLRNEVNQQFALNLPAAVAFDYPNVAKLSAHVWQLLDDTSPDDPETLSTGGESDAVTALGIHTLSEQEVNAALERELMEVGHYHG